MIFDPLQPIVTSGVDTCGVSTEIEAQAENVEEQTASARSCAKVDTPETPRANLFDNATGQ
jgi:hypothetical protein